MHTSRTKFAFVALLLLTGCSTGPQDQRKIDEFTRLLEPGSPERTRYTNSYASYLLGEHQSNRSEDLSYQKAAFGVCGNSVFSCLEGGNLPEKCAAELSLSRCTPNLGEGKFHSVVNEIIRRQEILIKEKTKENAIAEQQFKDKKNELKSCEHSAEHEIWQNTNIIRNNRARIKDQEEIIRKEREQERISGVVNMALLRNAAVTILDLQENIKKLEAEISSLGVNPTHAEATYKDSPCRELGRQMKGYYELEKARQQARQLQELLSE